MIEPASNAPMPLLDARRSEGGGTCRWVPDLTPLSGSWEGTSLDMPFRITVEESADGFLSGRAMITIGGQRVLFIVTGTHSYPHVRLTMRLDGHQDARYVGFFRSENFIVGELDGGSFSERSLDLYRQ